MQQWPRVLAEIRTRRPQRRRAVGEADGAVLEAQLAEVDVSQVLEVTAVRELWVQEQVVVADMREKLS